MLYVMLFLHAFTYCDSFCPFFSFYVFFLPLFFSVCVGHEEKSARSRSSSEILLEVWAANDDDNPQLQFRHKVTEEESWLAKRFSQNGKLSTIVRIRNSEGLNTRRSGSFVHNCPRNRARPSSYRESRQHHLQMDKQAVRERWRKRGRHFPIITSSPEK